MSDHEHERPGNAETAMVTESDPNADGPEGLEGDMGVSSERLGTVRGGDDRVTYTTAATHPDADEVGTAEGEDVPQEQSRASQGDAPEPNPDGVATQPHDPDRNPRHGV
ncbi:MAG: hypothetical protein JWR20_2407 [Marmoricola sp.]|nr:hypothetical protein [Marmoricola sp.]